MIRPDLTWSVEFPGDTEARDEVTRKSNNILLSVSKLSVEIQAVQDWLEFVEISENQKKETLALRLESLSALVATLSTYRSAAWTSRRRAEESLAEAVAISWWLAVNN